MAKHKYEDSGLTAAELERYVELCKRMYERMQRDNSWPWVAVTEPNNPHDKDNQDEDDWTLAA